MPTIHCMSNSDASEVDIHTEISVNPFLFRFIDRFSYEVKQITAMTIEQAAAFLGGDLIFAARFRQDDSCRVNGGRHGA